MSRDLGDFGSVSLNGFGGGQDRGWCYQITDNQGYVQMSLTEAEQIAKAILKDIERHNKVCSTCPPRKRT